MGSGKTTLGRRLAAQVGAEFVDLDRDIEALGGRAAGDVLRQDGEARFRALELVALEDVVQRAPVRCILATGGGIVETPAAPPLLRRFGTLVWLRADPEVCVARLGAARASRPLLDDGAGWRARWQRREPLYRALAQHVVDTHPQDESASLQALAAVWAAQTAG